MLLNYSVKGLDCKFMVAILALLSLVSCKDSGGDVEAVALSLSTYEISIDDKAQTFNIDVKSNVSWSVKSSEVWCKPSATYASTNFNRSLGVTCEANEGASERTAVLTFTAGDVKKECKVIQSATTGVLTGNKVEIGKSMQSFVVNMDKDVDYTVKCSEAWLNLESGDKASGAYTFAAYANHITNDRTATIQFVASGSVKREITVTQSCEFVDCKAKDLAQKFVAGWNLGNTLEAVGDWINSDNPEDYEEAWGNPVTTLEVFKMVKANGFNAVRIPCAWYSHVDDKSSYKINEKWMSRVKAVVDMAMSLDLMVILNIHWDNGWLENNCTSESVISVKGIQNKLWSQIANSFADYDEYLLFASANEPNAEDATQVNVLKQYHQVFVDAVRNAGGNDAKRCLVVQAPNTDIDKAAQNTDFIPTDNIQDKMMIEVHFYSPYQFCLMDKDADWGVMAYFWGAQNHYSGLVDGVNRNATWGEESYVNEEMEKMKNTYVLRGYPVIMGEYGCMTRTMNNSEQQRLHNQSRGYWYKYVSMTAKRNGILPFVWDAGGLLNRRTMTITDSYALQGIQEGCKESLLVY